MPGNDRYQRVTGETASEVVEFQMNDFTEIQYPSQVFYGHGSEVSEPIILYESYGSTDSLVRILRAHSLGQTTPVLPPILPAGRKGHGTSTGWVGSLGLPFLSTYKALFALALCINVGIIFYQVPQPIGGSGRFGFPQAAAAAAVNLSLSVIIRNEHVVNMLIGIACSVPHSSPLIVRKYACRIYHYGGVHSGCAVSALLWYLYFTVLLFVQIHPSQTGADALRAISFIVLTLLAVIIALSLPRLRKLWHDSWEMTHRYCGWAAVALVWTQVVLTAVLEAKQERRPLSQIIIIDPTFWLLIVITMLLIYPWLWLRRRRVTVEPLSAHAVRLHFKGQKLGAGQVHRLSHSPFWENHGFAVIPEPGGKAGFSILVSNAGDWTNELIRNPPTHIWTRSIPFTGFIRIARLFRPLVLVATGSGIGPCLSFLNVYQDHPVHIIWSARSPKTTYSAEIVGAIRRADPDAMIIDTKKGRTMDFIAMIRRKYEDRRAEAVFIISNQQVTEKVVNVLYGDGVTAFGAIFDS